MTRKKKKNEAKHAEAPSPTADAASSRAALLRAWMNPVPGRTVGWCAYEVNNVRQCENGVGREFCEVSLRGTWSATPCKP